MQISTVFITLNCRRAARTHGNHTHISEVRRGERRVASPMVEEVEQSSPCLAYV